MKDGILNKIPSVNMNAVEMGTSALLGTLASYLSAPSDHQDPTVVDKTFYAMMGMGLWLTAKAVFKGFNYMGETLGIGQGSSYIGDLERTNRIKQR